MRQLTNEVLLSSTHHQRDEADHANQRGRKSEHESEVDGRLVLLALHIGEKEEWECVDCFGDVSIKQAMADAKNPDLFSPKT